MSAPLNNKKIDICIATFKRPKLLSSLLYSIIRQKSLPDQNHLRIIVIDNDAHGTARKVVESFSQKTVFKVVYEIEPVQNIALARNRALKHVEGEYVLFIDDDEYVSDYWLKKLVCCALNYEADVVFGPVVPQLPVSTAGWIRKGKFFERKRYVTGAKRDRGATNNALIKAQIIKNQKIAFDQSFGLSGGEDSRLFYTFHKKGFKLIWCDEAEVYEHVSSDRITIKWICLRAFRGGQVFIRVFFSGMTLHRKISWCFTRFILMILFLLSLPILWILGRHLGVKALKKVCTYFGQLSAILKIKKYEEYRHT